MRKKIFLICALLMVAMAGNAQETILKGDMNDDGKITVADVTATVSTANGRTPLQYISAGSADPYTTDNSAIVGKWRTTTTGKEFVFNADSTFTSNSEDETKNSGKFLYSPFQGNITLYSTSGAMIDAYSLLSKGSDKLVMFRYGGTELECFYTDSKIVKAVNIEPATMVLKTGESGSLTYQIEPEDAVEKTVTWSSSDESIATVDQSGTVTAIAKGTATITATATDGSEVTGTCQVTVIQSVTSVTLDFATLLLPQNGSYQLNATILPEDASDKELEWTSSDENVVTVVDGLVEVVGEGEATITAKAKDGSEQQAECTVTVLSTEVDGISLSETALQMSTGETYTLKYEISPSDGDPEIADLPVEWSSSDENVAIVDENGVVTAKNLGTAVITVSVVGCSDITESCEITVVYKSTGVDLGLPSGTLWATCNVGTEVPEGAGLYFAWGESKGYEAKTSDGRIFNWTGYKLCNNGKSSLMTKYSTSAAYWDPSLGTTPDKKTVLEPVDDAATSALKWGDEWCMPTNDQMTELKTNCTWTWTTLNGTNGYEVTGTNGNSIFLPAAGNRYSSSLNDVGALGYYWTSSLNSGAADHAWGIQFGSGTVLGKSSYRYYGYSVRPVKKSVKTIAVTEITLSETSKTMYVDDTETITATVAPEDATYKTLSWSSNNTSVATVTQDGKVTAKACGTATITATSVDGADVTATCEITVVQAVTSVTLDKTTLTLAPESSYQLTATVLPENASDKEIVWTSSDETIAIVTAEGLVEALTEGDVTITATAKDGKGAQAVCAVTVSASGVQSVELSETEVTMNTGESNTLTCTFTPYNKSLTVEWSTSDEAVATVDEEGNITAKKSGTATITATVSGVTATCTVTVVFKPTSVDLGLTAMWATCNVGAEFPYEYGTPYEWSKEDAATTAWGDEWCMPSDEDIDELINDCEWTWTTLNEVKGYEVKGTNGNSIFLPAAGFIDENGESQDAGDKGYYWSITPDEEIDTQAWGLNFDDLNIEKASLSRSLKFYARPVAANAGE